MAFKFTTIHFLKGIQYEPLYNKIRLRDPALVKLTARKGLERSVREKSVIFLAKRGALQVTFT
jgi:hypothetical protein